MNHKFTIAGVQMFVHHNDVERNLYTMQNTVAHIARAYPFVEMILFSELCLYGSPFPAWRKKAETIPGNLTKHLCTLAQKYQKWLIPGSLYEKDGEKIFNTSIVIDPQGKIITKYRKMFPWQPLEETVPGNEFCVFDVPNAGRFGLCICYDMWFPEVCRTLAWMGADVILHPTMTASADREQEMVLSRANAIFNQFYFLDVNGTGFGGNGRSLMADPNGRILQAVETEATIMIEVLDFDQVKTTREYGTAGVSQVLKQFKSFQHSFPVYEKGIARGPGFKNLKRVAFPQKIKK